MIISRGFCSGVVLIWVFLLVIITAWKHKVLAVSFIIIWSPLYDNEI